MATPNKFEESPSISNTEEAVRMDSYPHIPGLPETYDELMECLEESEAEFERGETIPWEMAKAEAKAQIYDYAV